MYSGDSSGEFPLHYIIVFASARCHALHSNRVRGTELLAQVSGEDVGFSVTSGFDLFREITNGGVLEKLLKLSETLSHYM